MSINSFKIDKSLELRPQASPPVNPIVGEIYNDEATNKLMVYNGSSWVDLGGGGGGSGINYVLNSDAEVNLDGWATYSDAAGSIPVDGTGGSANITWTRSTSSPLRGAASFLFTKDAANRQGQGVSYNFTIDSADQGKVLQISADFAVASGTYDSGTSTTNSDLIAYIYDVTNARLIEPAGMKIMQGFAIKATFQTSIDSTSYRLIIHQSLTGTSAYTAKFDNFVVGPQATASGYAASDFISAGPITITGSSSNPTKGTTTIDRVMWRKEGDHARIRYEYRQTAAGTAGSGTYYFAIPSTIGTIDTSKQTVGTVSAASWVQTTGGADQNGASGFFVQAVAVDATKVSLITLSTVGGSPSLSNIGSSYWAMNQTSKDLSFEILVPIAGWSSNTVASSDTDTRVVAADLYGTDATNSTSLLDIPITVVNTDTHAGRSGNTYVVKVPGIYQIDLKAQMYTGSASVSDRSAHILVNGTTVATQTPTHSYSSITAVSRLLDLKVGDVVKFQRQCNGIAGTLSNASVQIRRLSGPAQITATETVAFEANTSTTAATTSTPFIYTNVVSNTHGSYNVSNGKFTAPIQGFYCFSWRTHTGATNSLINLYINGALRVIGSQSTAAQSGVGSMTVYLLAGHTAEIRPEVNATAAGSNNAASNSFSGHRVGN